MSADVEALRREVAARWRLAAEWQPSAALVAEATSRAAQHWPRGWPGFPPLPLPPQAPPTRHLAHLAGAYADFDELNRSHFGQLCPPLLIRINPRLRSTGGRVEPVRRIMDLNLHRLEELPETRVEIVFHEMIHLWLYTRGLDPGHTAAFKRKMRERGHLSIRYGVEGDPKGPRHAYPGSDRRVVYRCPHCGKEYVRRRRYGSVMLCGRCLKQDGSRHRIVEVAVRDGENPR